MKVEVRVTASNLKARCAAVLDEVVRKRQAIVITRHGRVIARLIPIEEEKPASVFGCTRGSITVKGDIITPIEADWEASR